MIKGKFGVAPSLNCLVARTIGGAGTGKTTELLNIIDKLINSGIGCEQIGFVSFTRAARREAAQRAADRFGVSVGELIAEGWFRTLHSVAYRCLGVKSDQLLTDDTESRRWIAEAVGEEVNAPCDSIAEDDNEMLIETKTDAARALRIWSYARNTMQPLADVWQHCVEIDGHTPPLSRVKEIIDLYEQRKRLDGRCDFLDLLARFAGVRFYTDGFTETTPEGVVPQLPVWFLDEAQDVSKLSWLTFQRLVSQDSCRYVYLSGDPFQNLYHFAGADHRLFMQWKAAKERIAPKSWRCPSEIMEVGERVLSRCSDYFDRKIAAAGHAGQVVRCIIQEVMSQVRADESWLILTRCKHQAASLKSALDEYATPWLDMHGSGTWNAPKRNRMIRTLMKMERGEPIRIVDWAVLMEPDGLKAEYLMHGTKAFWTRQPTFKLESMPDATPRDWVALGVTEKLAEMIRSGAWRHKGKELIRYADRYYRAAVKYNTDMPEKTKVRVGTIHSSKGAEADNVIVLTSTTQRCIREAESGEGYADAEHRVWYVAATRAKHRLYLCKTRMAEIGREAEYPI